MAQHYCIFFCLVPSRKSDQKENRNQIGPKHVQVAARASISPLSGSVICPVLSHSLPPYKMWKSHERNSEYVAQGDTEKFRKPPMDLVLTLLAVGAPLL